ncbi:hypothetical protein BKA80DRAFT_282461 [Phyllosticta citrichinensis]
MSDESTTTTTTTTSRGPASKSGTVCLRIRLLDGSQLRDYFSPTATLAADVRPRVDAAISSSPSSRAPPYTFKLLLAPQHPNRHLSASDETSPLHELDDIAPSATLVLVPVRNAAAASAYSGAGGGYIGSVYVALVAVYNLLTSFIGTFFAPFARGGGGGAAAGARPAAGEHADSAAAASSSGRDSSTGQRGAAAVDAARSRGNSSSPAAAAVSSSWSAKHMSAGGHASPSSGGGGGSGGGNESGGGGLDGQADAAAGSSASGAGGSGGGGGAGGGGLRFRTMRDRMGEDDDERRNEYYNGNSLGFEGDDKGHQGGDGGEQ